MNQHKRQLSINHSDHQQTKRLYNTIDVQKKSITRIESLSNDLLLDIFDYMNGCQLYESFWNLNTRFQDLLMFSSYPLKVSSFHLGTEHASDCCMKFIYSNRHRIISLHLSYWKTAEIFFKSMTIDQSFHRLESFVLSSTKSTDLIILLQILASLPRLYSLTLGAKNDFFVDDLSEINRLIFALPVLKYLRLYCLLWKFKISLRNKDNNQGSTIKCMEIYYYCGLNDLMILLSYTPHLRRLIFKGSLRAEEDIENKISVTLSNLHYIFIRQTSLSFDQFEPFMMNICSQLRTMCIVTNQDPAYLDAERWERLISKHLPYLQKFHFEYQEFFHNRLRVEEYHRFIPRFMSLFWIKRQWIFALRTTKEWYSNNEITYSIRPNKKEWYDLPENLDYNQSQKIICRSERRVEEASIESYISTELTADCFDLKDINPLLTIIRITALNIVDSEISLGKLIKLINHLPNLDTLSVGSIILEESEDSSLAARNASSSTTNQNKITKVNLWRLMKPREIQFLLDLCPNVKYLMVKHWSTVDWKLLVESILTHNISTTPYLHSMGLCTEENIDQTIEELQDMIHLENLTQKYLINRINDTIYIQWN